MEDAMVENHDVRTTQRLPRWVYRLLVLAVAWFVFAVWIFAGPAVTDYLLFIVSGFILVAMALVLILSQVKRDPAEQRRRGDPPVFHDRTGWDLDIFQTSSECERGRPADSAAPGNRSLRHDRNWHRLAHRRASGAADLTSSPTRQ
jgi:hypothetical protein